MQRQHPRFYVATAVDWNSAKFCTVYTRHSILVIHFRILYHCPINFINALLSWFCWIDGFRQMWTEWRRVTETGATRKSFTLI
jgi:hypothetical protein